MANDEGWAWFDEGGTYEMKVLCEDVTWDGKDDITCERYPGDNGVKFSINNISRIIKVKGLIFKSKDDMEEFIANLKSLNYANSNGWKFEYITHSDESKMKFDGTNDSINVLYKEYLQAKKVSRGDGQIYRIELLNLVE